MQKILKAYTLNFDNLKELSNQQTGILSASHTAQHYLLSKYNGVKNTPSQFKMTLLTSGFSQPIQNQSHLLQIQSQDYKALQHMRPQVL